MSVGAGREPSSREGGKRRANVAAASRACDPRGSSGPSSTLISRVCHAPEPPGVVPRDRSQYCRYCRQYCNGSRSRPRAVSGADSVCARHSAGAHAYARHSAGAHAYARHSAGAHAYARHSAGAHAYAPPAVAVSCARHERDVRATRARTSVVRRFEGASVPPRAPDSTRRGAGDVPEIYSPELRTNATVSKKDAPAFDRAECSTPGAKIRMSPATSAYSFSSAKNVTSPWMT